MKPDSLNLQPSSRRLQSRLTYCTATMPFSKSIGAAATVADAAVLVGGHAAALIPTHRQCSIEITNTCSSYALCNPSVFVDSGCCSDPLPPHVNPSSSGSALFIKTPNTARGAVGVFTYDLAKSSADASTSKIAVMFSVPYDFNLYSNWYAVGIFDQSKKCDYNLYYEMYNNAENMFVRGKAGGGLSHNSDRVAISATMSDSYQPVIKVVVKDN